MAKDINIHIKATGGAEAKQQLDGVAQSAQKTGTGVQDMGSKALIGSGWVQKALSFLAGPLGFAGIAGAVAGAAIKIAQFFDAVKTRSDEAVRKVQEIRASFIDLFEVMDVYSEKGRQALTKETLALFQKVGITKEAGLPIVTAYAREFKKTGLMPGPEYQAGLEQMLQWSALHPGRAAAEMPSLMVGFGLTTGEKQAQFTRIISAVSEQVGFDEADFIEALGRGMTGFKALAFTPEQAVEMAGKVAMTTKGLPARQRAQMLSNVLGALIAPQVPKEFEKIIPKEIREEPAELFDWVVQQQKVMPRKDYLKLLQGLYGAEAAPGLYAYITAPETGLRETMERAGGPRGAAEQAKQYTELQKTMETTAAKVEAAGRYRRLATITQEKELSTRLRELGQVEHEIEEKPVRQWTQDFIAIGTEAEKERAAFNRWFDILTEKEKEQYIEEWFIAIEPPGGRAKAIELYKGEFARKAARWRWKKMPTEIKLKHLMERTQEPSKISKAPPVQAVTQEIPEEIAPPEITKAPPVIPITETIPEEIAPPEIAKAPPSPIIIQEIPEEIAPPEIAKAPQAPQEMPEEITPPEIAPPEIAQPEIAKAPPVTTIIQDYRHYYVFNPVVGNKADIMGPRVPKGIC